MILVLASIVDRAAVAFAAELSDVTAASLFTLRDLAEGRSAFHAPGIEESRLTVAGQALPLTAIAGVVNLLPAVFPGELTFYPPEEREYQASELHALCLALLSALPCPVVNRPTPTSLTGPYTNPLGWHHLAHRLDVPTASLAIDSDAFVNPFIPPPGNPTIEVTCLNRSLVSPSGTDADRHTLALAGAADVVYLRAMYGVGEDGPRLITVSTVPDIGDGATRRALIDLLAGNRHAG